MKKTLYLSLLLCLACTKSNRLYLKAQHVEGLESGAEAKLNGAVIGSVSDINLQEDLSLVLELDLNGAASIPTDTRFQISSLDIFGSKGIEVIKGSSSHILKPGDTAVLHREAHTPADSFGDKIRNIIEELKSASTNNDSLLIELRRLNQNLERISAKEGEGE